METTIPGAAGTAATERHVPPVLRDPLPAQCDDSGARQQQHEREPRDVAQGRNLAAADSFAAHGLYLLAAARAYEYLFTPASAMELAFDPGFDLTSEVYKKAASAYLQGMLDGPRPLADHFTEILRETYRVRVERGPDVWDPDDFDEILLADALDVKGFRNYHRQAGFGVPLVGVRENRQAGRLDAFYPPEGLLHPVTAVLRFDVDRPPPTGNCWPRSPLIRV